MVSQSDIASFATPENRRRIVGWYFFDWASQPFGTLLLTFIFAPYIAELLGEGSDAQALWGYGTGAAGVVIALLAPMLGAIADRGGPTLRYRMLWLFSTAYCIGAAGLWIAAPDDINLIASLALIGLGMIGLEFSTVFTNAMLPEIAPRREMGRISGTGWAFGYLGGLVALVLMLGFFAENGGTGLTLFGQPPALGLDADAREGTRFVGPFTALWFLVFMVPFFLWCRPPPEARAGLPIAAAARSAWPDLKAALAALPGRRSLAAYLAASMAYRDALNGLYFFGGIYAAGMLGWSVTDVGVFGIVAIITAALVAWASGHCDSRFGPKPVIVVSVVVLALTTLAAIFISREAVFGFPVGPDSRLPDIAFYIVGAAIGGAGGSLGASSRCMLVRQAPPAEIGQSFGLYALAGKATAFVAPLAVAAATDWTGSQPLGIVPLLVLFLLGLVLLIWVKPDGETAP